MTVQMVVRLECSNESQCYIGSSVATDVVKSQTKKQLIDPTGLLVVGHTAEN